MPFGVRVFAKPSSLARRTLSCLSFSRSNGVIVRSLMVCSRLQKCSAIPDLSNFLLIMSRLCESPFQSSACLSDVLAVLVSVVKQRLHCNA